MTEYENISFNPEYHIGVDIGRHVIEAVITFEGEVIGCGIHSFTDDVIGPCANTTIGDVMPTMRRVLLEVMSNVEKIKDFNVMKIHCLKLGLSELVGCVEERNCHLSCVAVIRLCGPTTQGLPPFSGFPSSICQVLGGPVYMTDGGYMLDGETEIQSLNKAEIYRIVDAICEKGVTNIVISGVFSLKNNAQEIQVRQWIQDKYPEVSVTLTHEVGCMSLLPRENAAIFNESLKPLARDQMKQIRTCLEELGISCPHHIVMNDGTLVGADVFEQFPIRTIATGTASCMRAASLLTGIKDGIVLDISRDAIIGGNLREGQPIVVHNKLKIGDIPVSIARPDTITVTFGKLKQQAQIACAENKHVMPCKPGLSNQSLADIVDQIKSSKDDVDVVLVGEGAPAWVDKSKPVKGTTSVILSPHYQVSHAIGALLTSAEDGPSCVSHLEKCCQLTLPTSENPGRTEDVIDLSFNDLQMDQCSTYDRKDTAPYIEESSGEWILSEHDIECIAIGAGILGCGGGGNPYLGKLSALQQIRNGKRIRVISPQRFVRRCSLNDFAFPVASMGAPAVQVERLTDPWRLKAAVEALAELYSVPGYTDDSPLQATDFGRENKVLIEGGNRYIEDFKSPDSPKFVNGKKNVAAVFAVEIGGSNSMEPFLLGSEIDVPVIDCDCMGRALPEIQMFSQYIYGSNWFPAAVGDSNGRKCVCLHAESPKHLEDFCRKSCIEMGSLASFCGRPLSAPELLNKTILHSTSRAWQIGDKVIAARQANSSPVQAILQFEQGKLICTAKISDVRRDTAGGFTGGEVTLRGKGEFASRTFSILIHNENLIAQEITEDGNVKILATVPDLISIVDLEEGETVTTDELKYGLRVAVLALPAPALLTTPQALRVVGPQAFGFEGIEFKPIGRHSAHNSVPPE